MGGPRLSPFICDVGDEWLLGATSGWWEWIGDASVGTVWAREWIVYARFFAVLLLEAGVNGGLLIGAGVCGICWRERGLCSILVSRGIWKVGCMA